MQVLQIFYFKLVFLSLFVLLGCNNNKSDLSKYNLIRIEAHEFKYTIPDTITEGYNIFRLINHGNLIHEGLIFKFLNDSFSIAHYIDSVSAGIDFPSFSIDLGGPGMTTPYDSNEVIINLTPGKYGIVCWVDNHLMLGMNKEFFVTETSYDRSKKPKEDLVLELSDTAFTFSKLPSKGNNLIKVINAGAENHEVDFIKLFKGVTSKEYIKWKITRDGDPKGLPVGGSLDINPGCEIWLPMTFKEGKYLLTCVVPNKKSGKSHLEEGKFFEFEIK
jgi:uncharacterized cupredoxin-like copper-binding protein